jgi:RNase H-fold protein (predicted Holliday junction resolvase)
VKYFKTFKEFVNELIVAPRNYKTYRENEWDYNLILKLLDELFGFDEESTSKIISTATIEDLVKHYGATFHQENRVVDKVTKILKLNGWSISKLK